MGTGLERTRVPGARLWLKHWAGVPLILAYLSGPAFARAGEHPSAYQKKLERGQRTNDPIELPMVFYDRTGFVRLVVNQKPLVFLVDTASLTIVNRDRLDLPVVRKTQARTVTATGSANLPWQTVQIDTLALGGESITGLRVLSKSLRELEVAFGREVDGILGADVLMRWDAVKIDYKNGKLVLDGMSPDP